MIDFSPLSQGDVKMLEFSAQFTLEDLRQSTHESINFLKAIFDGLHDEDVVFMPYDPEANDPYAPEDQQHIGWTLGHLVAHVTASSEEGAAFCSILGRGYALEERPRYETAWETMDSVAKCLQRLEESRRMRLAYLDTLPDTPFLEVYRKVSERFEAKFGKLNAIASFLFGLSHEVGHYAQFQEVRRQAIEARLAK